MNFKEPKEPIHQNLELSQEALEAFHKRLTSKIVTSPKSTYGEIPDAQPVENGREDPLVFSLPLAKETVKHVLYPNNDEVLPFSGSEAQCTTDHRLEDVPGKALSHLSVVSMSRIRTEDYRTEMTMSERYSIRKVVEDNTTRYEGEVTIDYARDGKRVSLNDIQPGTISVYDDKQSEDLVDDVTALDRPMTIDDLEKIEALLDVST